MGVIQELYIVLICISAAYCQDGNTCQNEIIQNSVDYCKNSTGFDETTCSNLECYIACVEDYYGDCGTTDKFYYVDSVVFRVQQRARCHDIQFHDNAHATCDTTETICSAESQATMKQLLDESLFNFFMGNYDVYKTVTCRLHPLIEECISAVLVGNCDEELANYVNEYANLANRISSCDHLQNTTMFKQYGGDVTCSDYVMTEQIPTLWTTVNSEESITVLSESTGPSTKVNGTATSVESHDGTSSTLGPHDGMSSPETFDGTLTSTSEHHETTSALLNTASIDPSDVNVTAATDENVTHFSLVTTTIEPTQRTPRNVIGGRNLGDNCNIATIATDMQDKGCKWPLKFLTELPDNYCDGLECLLACYEESVGTCDREDFRLNKITNRIHLRFFCDYNSNGRLGNENISQFCEYSRCFASLVFAIKNVIDHTNYCKLFNSMRECSAYITTEECTSEMSYYETQYTMLGYDYCSPENGPMFEKFGHPPVATGCKYGSQASTFNTLSVMLWLSFCAILMGTCSFEM